MFRKSLAVLSFLVFVCVPVACLAGESDYYSSGVGFGITLPDGWRFTEKDTFVDAHGGSRLSDEEISEAIDDSGVTNPLLAQITNKTPDGSDSNSVVNINVMYFNVDMPLTELMELIADNLEDTLMDFEMLEDVDSTTVSGQDAAYFWAEHGQTDAPYDDLPMNTREWIVRRGDVLFSIGVSWAIEDPLVNADDIDTIISSIRIDP